MSIFGDNWRSLHVPSTVCNIQYVNLNLMKDAHPSRYAKANAMTGIRNVLIFHMDLLLRCRKGLGFFYFESISIENFTANRFEISSMSIFENRVIVKISFKSLKNSFLKNGIIEFWSETLIVSISTYSSNDNYFDNQNEISTKIVITNFCVIIFNFKSRQNLLFFHFRHFLKYTNKTFKVQMHWKKQTWAKKVRRSVGNSRKNRQRFPTRKSLLFITWQLSANLRLGAT